MIDPGAGLMVDGAGRLRVNFPCSGIEPPLWRRPAPCQERGRADEHYAPHHAGRVAVRPQFIAFPALSPRQVTGASCPEER